MSPLNAGGDSGAEVNAIGWAYWQRGGWYSIDCEPVMIELREDRLSLRIDARWLAETPTAGASARYTRLGALRLSLDGKEFVLLDDGGRVSRSPSHAFIEPIRTTSGKEVRSVAGWQQVLLDAGIPVEGKGKSAVVIVSAALAIALAALAALVIAFSLAGGR